MNHDQQTAQKLREVGARLDATFLGKGEAVRLMLITLIAGEHMLLIGPPGTAKSALVRLLARLVDARYFEYLLTRFTEPNELFGPLDIQAFQKGDYTRRMEGMLPTADIAFLDEAFKANSAILNSLLGVLNERVYTVGGRRVEVPLLSAFAASNEVPSEPDLMAVFDRFLLRVESDNLESYYFDELLSRGVEHELSSVDGRYDAMSPLLDARALRALRGGLAERMHLSPELLSTYKGLVLELRAEGVSLSDRRAVKLLKLIAASALLDGRDAADDSDLFVLRHVWNTLEQAKILDGIVGPVLEAHQRTHPSARRDGASALGLEGLLGELERIRARLSSERALSDIQLFSQLKALGELKAALEALGSEGARLAVGRVDKLLSHVFESGKYAP